MSAHEIAWQNHASDRRLRRSRPRAHPDVEPRCSGARSLPILPLHQWLTEMRSLLTRTCQQNDTARHASELARTELRPRHCSLPNKPMQTDGRFAAAADRQHRSADDGTALPASRPLALTRSLAVIAPPTTLLRSAAGRRSSIGLASQLRDARRFSARAAGGSADLWASARPCCQHRVRDRRTSKLARSATPHDHGPRPNKPIQTDGRFAAAADRQHR